MNLTGKCKEAFEEWYIDFFADEDYLYDFYENHHPSEKYGVYVDFFDSKGIRISIRNIGDSYWYVINHPNILGLKDRHESKFTGRPETRSKAVEKADEIYNSSNK